MAVQFKWPIVGIIIPCVLVSIIGYGTHYFVLRNNASWSQQLFYEFLISIIWLNYYIAIIVDPGFPPENYEPGNKEWKRWCKKCENYKPERTHHCRTCNKCVLKMDHHCPWTINCVGHKNLPHFMRFLTAVVFGTGYTLAVLCGKVSSYYHTSHLPSYLLDKKEVAAVIILLPLDFFVVLTVSILYIRCIINLVFRGMSQIEVWEMERIESHFHTTRFWLQIRKNYFNIHGKNLPKLTSWVNGSGYVELDNIETDEGGEEIFAERGWGLSKDINSEQARQEDIGLESREEEEREEEREENIIPKNFTVDDLVFPYNYGIWNNIVSSCGYPWDWILPWRAPKSNGWTFVKTEDLDDQLDIPWPPDGGDQLMGSPLQDKLDLTGHNKGQPSVDRMDWINSLGESLQDFGVDLDEE